VLIAPPARASWGSAPSRSLAIFYRFTVEEALENGDRAYAALDQDPAWHTDRRLPALVRSAARDGIGAVTGARAQRQADRTTAGHRA
jgi:hypothetical protein